MWSKICAFGSSVFVVIVGVCVCESPYIWRRMDETMFTLSFARQYSEMEFSVKEQENEEKSCIFGDRANARLCAVHRKYVCA